MTEAEQNIAIAASNGWTQIEDRSNGLMMQPGFLIVGYPPSGAIIGKKSEIPNCFRDLNAQFEAWQQLTDAQKFAFRNWVARIATREGIWAEEAQAKFGAECILRALGKWVESTFPLTPCPK